MESSGDPQFKPHVIPLSEAPGEREAWGRSKFVVYAWAIAERLFVTNSWQISSGVRVAVLRRFGAKIGSGVVFRPRTRVSFPWRLTIGDNAWIGEGVWFHNQDQITIGHDAIVSQETFLTTGSHAHRRDMALITRPIIIEPGAWVTSRCMVLGGVTIGTSALIRPGTLVDRDVAPGRIFGSSAGEDLGPRFKTGS